MPEIEENGMGGEEATHQEGQGTMTRLQEEMGVIVQKGPCKALGIRFPQELRESFQEGCPIFVVPKDGASLHAPHNDVLQESWSVQSCRARHVLS
jgi:hypothetical protein